MPSVPASAATIVTFSVDNVTFSGDGGTYLMKGTFDWNQTANTLSSNFNLTLPNHTPVSPIWISNFTFIGTDPLPAPGSQLFGFRDDSGPVGALPDVINFSFVHDSNAPFVPGETFSVAGHDSTFPNQFTESSIHNLSTADSTLVVTNVTNTPLPAALPLFATGLAGLGWFATRRRKRAAA